MHPANSESALNVEALLSAPHTALPANASLTSAVQALALHLDEVDFASTRGAP